MKVKKVFSDILSQLVFICLCMAVPFFLPGWIVEGIMLVILFAILVSVINRIHDEV